MKSHWMNLSYILKHKWFVLIECIKLGVPLWAAVIHDWQKFTPAEWKAYRINFFGPYKKDERPQWLKDLFEQAWRHHLQHGPHHWEYWVHVQEMQEMQVDAINSYQGADILPDAFILQLTANTKIWVREMPERYMREMLADWRGAGRAIKGEDDSYGFYHSKKEKIRLHPETRKWIELQLWMEAMTKE